MINYERHATIGIIRLNRPDKLNAISSELADKFTRLLTELRSDNNLRALVLTGSGDEFCAGTDISELDGLSEKQAGELSARGQELCELIESFPVPVIAAVDGVAAGGGCELALACHLRIASTRAEFSLPETKLGLIPAYGGTQRLPREIGLVRAVESMVAGKQIDARSAYELGLVNRIVEPEQLLTEAMGLANEIASLAPLAIRACLRAVTEGLKLPFDEGLALERELFASLFATEDAREGTRAFLEKRQPTFRGR